MSLAHELTVDVHSVLIQIR